MAKIRDVLILTLPAEWQAASALETASASAGRTAYKPTTLETLIDSPVYAGRYAKVFDLDPGADVVKAKSIIDLAHNNAVIGALRRYLETA